MIGRRDNFITVSNPVESYDDVGDLVVTTTTGFTFWGNIKDKPTSDDISSGKRRDVRMIEIEVDSRDIEDLTINHTLTYDGSTNSFQVVDFYDSKGTRFTNTIIAQSIN